ncbi:MAG TPA: V-type ATP synthase subunit E family protein [Methanoregulaceae archaeon]|nr:V-type ATP synthase subunit E family protein [Methanoregulaceae archaeon]HOV68411.1 V-type ATP synthase subunit E family protein [Methanoregulaceae archaeon]HQJ88246.1 V-type ATP synthase subunit E family protein [Methanoregulaceae archaeon]
MGLEAVVSEIQQKGRQEADRIRREADLEVERILRDAQQRSDEIKLSVEADVTRQVEHILAQETSSAHLVTKRAVLNAEKELLDQAYRATLEAIRKEPAAFHEKALRRLLEVAKAEIGGGRVRVNRVDLPIIEALVREPGFAVFTVGPPAEIEGGLVAESNDRAFQVDHSYRTYLNRVWESSLKDASDLLFG